MPEGPEIRRAADSVAAAVQGERIEKLYFGLDGLKQWEPVLAGTRVERVETRGKAMLIRFSNGLTIYTHNQLYGRWMISRKGVLPDTSRQLRLALHTRNQSALLFSASDIEVLDSEGLKQHPFLTRLGPDVLDKGTTADQITARLESERYKGRSLGMLLIDQSFVAGLGNYLRCEILFLCGLHPVCRPLELGDEQRERLAKKILELPGRSYRTGGVTRTWQVAKEAMEEGASFEEARFWVFRRTGQQCYQCGERVELVSQGGKSCYLCPGCQQKH